MPDSSRSEELEAKHEQIDQERLESVRRWVEYIQEEPPDVWGPQQNRLVNSQLQSARETGFSAEHEQRIRAFADSASQEERDDTTPP